MNDLSINHYSRGAHHAESYDLLELFDFFNLDINTFALRNLL